MTRKEAIKVIKIIEKRFITLDKEERQALILAIKALEQEPCEDCVDRNAVLIAVCTNCEKFCSEQKCRKYTQIANLPSVQPTQPCEDAVSRKSVLDVINNPLNIRIDKIIEKLPTVTPKSLDDVLNEIKNVIKDNTYFINEVTEKEGIDFETVEKIIDKYMAESEGSNADSD